MKNLLLLCSFILNCVVFADALPPGCEYDKECFFDAPGMKCADGTQSYFTITPRKDAKNLLIYLNGGGGCWSKSSCQNGLARPLTRQVVPTDWNNGRGIFNRNEPTNPFRTDYNLVNIAYCTGDVYAGDKTVNYGSASNPYMIQHHGFKNVQITLTEVQKYYPFPEKAVLIGQSAGGFGTIFHAKSMDTYFPGAKKYVIDDSGVPLSPPFLTEKSYIEIVKNWGIENTFPYEKPGSLKDYNFEYVIEANLKNLPTTRFGLIGAYSDRIMTFFANRLGSPNSFTAVRDTLIDTAKNRIGDSEIAKVFYLTGSEHCYVHRSIGSISSKKVVLGKWMTAMINDDTEQWTNVRPDLSREIPPVDPDEFYASFKR